MTNTTLLNSKNYEVLEKFLQNNLLIDDHKGQQPKEAVALIEYNSKFKPLGAAFSYWYYCINQVYYKDGRLHLSECSIGGNLYGIPSKEDIEKYNESAVLGGGLIKRVWFHDGTILEFDLGEEDLENKEA